MLAARSLSVPRLLAPAASLRALLSCAVLALLLAGCGREVRDWSEVRRRAHGAELSIESRDPQLAAAAARATADWNYGGRLVAGSFDAAEVQVWLDRLGVESTASGLSYAGFELGGPDDLLLACFEDPDQPGLPVTLYLGSGATLQAWLGEARPLSRRPSVRLVLGRETALTGKLSRDGALIDGSQQEVHAQLADLRGGSRNDGAADPRPYAVPEGLRVLRGHGVSVDRARAYLAHAAQALDRAQQWSGSTATSMQLDLVGDPDDYALLGGAHDFGVVDPTGRLVAALLAEGCPDDGGAALAEAAARQLLGPPADERTALAFGLAAAGECFGRSLDSWPVAEARAPLESAVALAQRFEDLGVRGELDAVRALWAGTEAASAGTHDPQAPARRAWSVDGDRELRGIVVDLPGRPLVDTLVLRRECKVAPQWGANGLSLTCDLVTQPLLPECIGERAPLVGRTRQGDALLIALLARARASGLAFQALRPRVFEADSGEQAARRKRTTPQAWATFFDESRGAFAHAALLAETARVDLLCVGEQLSAAVHTKVASEPEADADLAVARLAGWRDVVQLSRARYGGDLTYLASWPQEQSRVAFWDELDVLALSWFPKLATGAPHEVDARGLKNLFYGQLDAMSRRARELDKRFLLLGCGIPASEFAWRDTQLAPGAVDEAEQARLYAGLLAAVDRASRDLDNFAGLALTGWGATADAEGRSDRAVGRPAQGSLLRLLSGGQEAQ